MRLPNELQNKNQEYCIKQCDPNAQSCPSNNSAKKDIANNFNCISGFYKYNFQCIPQSIADESKYIFLLLI